MLSDVHDATLHCITTYRAVLSREVPQAMLHTHARTLIGAICDLCGDRSFNAILPHIIPQAGVGLILVVRTGVVQAAAHSTFRLISRPVSIRHRNTLHCLGHPADTILDVDAQGCLHRGKLLVREQTHHAALQGHVLPLGILQQLVKERDQRAGRGNGELPVLVEFQDAVPIQEAHPQEAIKGEGLRGTAHIAGDVEGEGLHQTLCGRCLRLQRQQLLTQGDGH
mmetsp:Transcript_104964/g.249879  ORF Transcript_104964/g.249879 Transcript_104964/m.249879 type:complete len:224 (+) Transcript_104964:805-1476(+)